LKGDLHVHTTASDGRLSPQELVSLAVQLELDVVAITDHDSIDGILPAMNAAELFSSFTIIPGVEIGTDVIGGEIHVLGYFIDYTDSSFLAILNDLRDSREGRAQKMISKLKNMGMPIKWERVRQLAQDGSVGRPHVAQVLLEAGYVSSIREAFDKYIGRNGPAYAERKKMTPLESVEMIINSSGLPVLAHPAYIENLEEVLTELKGAGLVGMEVYYGGYDAEAVEKLAGMAAAFDLIPTGGSDYHAFDDGAETMLGGALAPAASIDKLFSVARERCLKTAMHR
jgi:predicted metal-dependent phosphoesterase TrpH